jgi:hypothetical protein
MRSAAWVHSSPSGSGGYGGVLQPTHGRHEPGQLRRRVNGLDFGESAGFGLGVGHDCFHTSRRSSVVVMVDRSDSVLSTIAEA